MNVQVWAEEQQRLRGKFLPVGSNALEAKRPALEPIMPIVMKTSNVPYDTDKTGMWVPPPGQPGGPPK